MTETAVGAGARWSGPWGRALAVGMAMVVVVPAVGVAQPDGGLPPEVLSGELGDLDDAQEQAQRELAAIESRTGDARAVLAEVVAELDDAEVARAQAETDLAAASNARDDALAAVERAEARLADVTDELAVTELELAARRAQLDARVRAGFKYGQVSFLEAFLGTADIAEFLNSNTYVASVLEGDRVLVEDVIGLLDAVERQRATAIDLRDEADRSLADAEAATVAMDEALQELAVLAATIDERRREQVVALAALEDDRASIESHLSGLEVESQRIGAQLAAIAAQQAEEEARRQAAAEQQRREQEAAEAAREAERQAEEQRLAAEREARREQRTEDEAPASGSSGSGSNGSGSNGSGSSGSGLNGSGSSGSGDELATPAPSAGGNWVRPVAGRLTSGFGPRWGRNHNGVDLAGTVGSGVVAARPGTVVHTIASCHPTSSFGCGGGFGNYVLVAHPGGFATIYAHLSSVAVVVGDEVAAGQALGGIGNSGNSYGSHLHFEIREAGVPRNPCGYISC